MKKTICITGATSGFGEACARLFAKHNWQLILTGRRLDRLEKIKSELDTQTHIIAQDIRDRAAVEKDVRNLPEKFRVVDVLVNNAGLALGLGPAQDADLDQWETMIDTNIKGLIYSTRFFLPLMVQNNSGLIVNIGSVAGTWPYPGANVYGATKAFVKQLSHNLRTDLLGTKIRVSNLEPGLAETEFSLVRLSGDKEKADDIYKGTKPLAGEDIAEIVWWIANQPPHVNINRVEVMPVCQSCGPFAISREDE